MLEIVSPRIIAHSSYSEGDHCPLSLSEGPKVHTFFSVKGRRPVLYFTVSLSEGPQARTFFSVIPQRPALYFTVSLKIPAKKWGDTEIAERGRSVLVMRARYRSAGLIPHQRGWTDAG